MKSIYYIGDNMRDVKDDQLMVNDIVVYKNNINDQFLYCIKEINEETKTCIIQGINYRLKKLEKLDMLKKADDNNLKKEESTVNRYKDKIISTHKKRNKVQKYLLGKILHIDGDQEYLDKCLELYKELGIYCFGISLSEKNIFSQIKEYIYDINPDIIVITGHDLYNEKGLVDIDNYKNTKHFISALKEIRKVNQVCCVIAGACQSNYEALIANGANFASSPERINVHTFDPAVIAIKVATTSFLQLVDIDEIYHYIENGKKAFGGVQTTGKMKLVYD